MKIQLVSFDVSIILTSDFIASRNDPQDHQGLRLFSCIFVFWDGDGYQGLIEAVRAYCEDLKGGEDS